MQSGLNVSLRAEGAQADVRTALHSPDDPPFFVFLSFSCIYVCCGSMCSMGSMWAQQSYSAVLHLHLWWYYWIFRQIQIWPEEGSWHSKMTLRGMFVTCWRSQSFSFVTAPMPLATSPNSRKELRKRSWTRHWREAKKSNREEKEKFEILFSNLEKRKRTLKFLSPVSRREREICKKLLHFWEEKENGIFYSQVSRGEREILKKISNFEKRREIWNS